MAKKSIGGIDEQVKASFDDAQTKLGAGSANETLAALLERFDDNAMTDVFDDIEVAGVKEVKRILTNAARQMVMVLSHRYDEQNSIHDADAQVIAECRELVAKFEAEHADDVRELEERDKTIKDLRKKAASVDTLSERIDKMVKTFDHQVDRYESDLAAAKERLDQMTAERDELADQLKAMTSERDTLAAEVERLIAELAEVMAGKA